MPDSANVQLAPDSTGKKVRTLEVTLLQTDGTLATVEMQVISIADPNTGRSLSVMTSGDVGAILDKLDEIKFAIETK